MSLDEVFSDKQQPEQVEKVEEEREEQSSSEQDENVEDVEVDTEKEEEAETTSTEEDDEKQSWTLAAVKDERAKRQEAQKRAEELERQLEELKRGDSKRELPDVFDDQQGFVKSIRDEFTSELASAKLEMAREFMMESHPDYEEMEQKFIEIAKENPVLRSQAQKASNPAKFAYQQAKKYVEWQEMQDVDKFKEKMKAEAKAELEAELRQAKEKKASKVADISPSLAKARASDKEQTVDDSLESIFGTK